MMEDWKNGILEGWKNGKLEEWNNGMKINEMLVI